MSPTLRRPALVALLLAAVLSWWGTSAPAQDKTRQRPRPPEPPPEAPDLPPPPLVTPDHPAPPTAAPDQRTPPPLGGGAIHFGARWEYRVVPYRAGQSERELERALNELGAQGWELAGTASRTTSGRREAEAGEERPAPGGAPAAHTTSVLILKRARLAGPPARATPGGPDAPAPRAPDRRERE
jgi:hypothetical protein